MSAPMGRIELAEKNGCLVRCQQTGEAEDLSGATPVLEKAAQQLREYFAGTRTVFDLPLAPEGTDFQTSVWKALTGIPYGRTWSYKDLAQAVDSPKGYRAVGAANGKNPIWIIIPCHRVINENGALGGYAGGLEVKKRLLALEQAA